MVLWSRASVKSDWVISEASRAHRQEKLIPLLLPPLKSHEVPSPFAVRSMLPHADLAALVLALKRRGAKAG